jgi:hypothetical protein
MVPSPLDEAIVVRPRGLYFYEFSRTVCCLICVSQVEIVGMLLTSTRNLAEWKIYYLEEIGAQTVGHGTHFSIRAEEETLIRGDQGVGVTN